MNKSELTEALAQEQNLTNSEAAKIINHLLDAMCEALSNGENVEIRGFGSFSVRGYDSYTGRNPKTGEKITVKAKKLPYFKVGKSLREAVNGHRDK